MSTPVPVMDAEVPEAVEEEAVEKEAVIVKPKKRRGKEPIGSYNLDCPHCKYIGTTKTGLLNHIRMHLLEVVFTCALCQFKCNSNNELIEHKLVHKDEKRSFLCRKCEMAFTEHHDWLQHELEHMTNQKTYYKCPECTKYFKQKHVAQNHLSTHFNLNLKCELCTEVFKTELQLKLHTESHDTSFECCECGLVFNNKTKLNQHMLFHTGIKPHQCLYCGQAFMTTSAKLVHTRKHTGDTPYKCTKCHRQFTQQADFQRHKCIFENREKVECKVCKRKLFKWTMTAHMKLHTNDKRYKCPDCKEAFVSNASLKVHLLYRHSNEKPLKCTEEGCSAAFKTKSDLKRHFFQVHNK